MTYRIIVFTVLKFKDAWNYMHQQRTYLDLYDNQDQLKPDQLIPCHISDISDLCRYIDSLTKIHC